MERGKPIIRRKWQGGTPIRAVGIEASQGIFFFGGPSLSFFHKPRLGVPLSPARRACGAPESSAQSSWQYKFGETCFFLLSLFLRPIRNGSYQTDRS